MARNIIFKTLIDILFIFQGFGLLGVFINMPFGVTKINQVNLNVLEWSALFWILLIFSIVSFLLFLVGLFFLRKVGRYLLSNRYFNIGIISNLKKSGRFFILSGITGIIVFLMTFFIKFNSGHLTIYNTDMALPVFISIIGLFFIIQSETLLTAKTHKEENDLTI